MDFFARWPRIFPESWLGESRACSNIRRDLNCIRVPQSSKTFLHRPFGKMRLCKFMSMFEARGNVAVGLSCPGQSFVRSGLNSSLSWPLLANLGERWLGSLRVPMYKLLLATVFVAAVSCLCQKLTKANSLSLTSRAHEYHERRQIGLIFVGPTSRRVPQSALFGVPWPVPKAVGRGHRGLKTRIFRRPAFCPVPQGNRFMHFFKGGSNCS